ncbi:MAG: hypothetical protein ABSB95_07565 [Dissulfurispiraceae bacterium]
MNKILTIVLALLLAVFVASVALAEDNSFVYGPVISLSGSPSEGSATSEMSANAAQGEWIYGPQISLSERAANSEISFTAEDHSYSLEGRRFCVLSISPADGNSIAERC